MVKCNLFLGCKAEFSASLLQSSGTKDLSEIILIYGFAAQKAFMIIISVALLHIFVYIIYIFTSFDDSNFKQTAFSLNDFILYLIISLFLLYISYFITLYFFILIKN